MQPEQEKSLDERSDAEGRESIWSVDPGTKTVYFILFIIQVAAGVGVVSWDTFHEYDTIWDIWRYTWAGASPLVITSAAVSIAITELGGYLMVLSRGLRERLERTKQQRRAEGRVEGRAEVEAKVEAWNNRRLEAERKGEPFNEPLPIRTKDG